MTEILDLLRLILPTGGTGAWLCSNLARDVSVPIGSQHQPCGRYEAEAKVI
jgi:hypothetical protein